MKRSDSLLAKSLLVAAVIIGIATFLLITRVQPSQTTHVFNPVKATSDDPTPTPTPNIPEVKLVDVHSSDGTKKMTMRAEPNAGSTMYSFSTMDATGNNVKQIFTKTIAAGESLGIPYNSWSPDNKLVLLQYNHGGSADFWVFRADGTAFPNGEQYLDINAYWAKNTSGYAIRSITGWAAGDLVIVYTKKEDGSSGPAFWFVIGTHAFLQLAR